MNRTQNGWVFGPKGDIAVFTGPLLISVLFYYFHKMALFGFDNTTVAYQDPTGHYYFIQTYINLAHLYSTFWYTYTSPTQWRAHKPFFIWIPIILFCANLIAGWFGGSLMVYIIFAHFSIWHFIKQQQAWFHISANKGAPRDKWTVKIDNAAIIACTLGFSIASQSEENARGWFSRNDLIELPHFLFWPVLITSIACLLLYVVWHGIKIYKKEPVNWNAHHMMMTSAFVWGWTRLATQNPYTYYINQLTHAVPYLYLGYRHMVAERARGERFWLPQVPVWIIAILILILAGQQGHFEMSFRFGDYLNDSLGYYRMYLVGSFFNAINITHYAIDMFYWNRKHNPNWTKALA